MHHYSVQWNPVWVLMGTEPVRMGFLSVWTQKHTHTHIKHTHTHCSTSSEATHIKSEQEIQWREGSVTEEVRRNL